jgi:hypothetical protein
MGIKLHNPQHRPSAPPLHNPVKVIAATPVLVENTVKFWKYDRLSPPGLPEASTTPLFTKKAIGPNAYANLAPKDRGNFSPYFPVLYEFPTKETPAPEPGLWRKMTRSEKGHIDADGIYRPPPRLHTSTAGVPMPLGNPIIHIGPHLLSDEHRNAPGLINYEEVPSYTLVPKNGSHLAVAADSAPGRTAKAPRAGGVKVDGMGMPILPKKLLKEYNIQSTDYKVVYPQQDPFPPSIPPFQSSIPTQNFGNPKFDL